MYQTVALLAVLSWVEVRWVRENYKQRKKRMGGHRASPGRNIK